MRGGKSQEEPTMRLFVRPGRHSLVHFPSPSSKPRSKLSRLAPLLFVSSLLALSLSPSVTALQSHAHTTATLCGYFWVTGTDLKAQTPPFDTQSLSVCEAFISTNG